MTTGEKLSKLRKENNYTQEQLADLLGVSRQAISRWESDLSYPETDKLIKLAEMYHCSVDYLLKEAVTETQGTKEADSTASLLVKTFFKRYEYKSKRILFGMPLVHINIGFNTKAKGIIAIGTRAYGFLSIGLFSMGILSLGICSLGAIALGVFGLGILALGTIAIGILALGAIAIGVFALGAVAVGFVSSGALAISNFFASGDHAYGLVAIAKTKAQGEHAFLVEDIQNNQEVVTQAINDYVPAFFRWFANIFRYIE